MSFGLECRNKTEPMQAAALVEFLALSERFEGVDLQCRRQWRNAEQALGGWRARLVTNKNSRNHFRLEAWGTSAEEAAAKFLELFKRASHT